MTDKTKQNFEYIKEAYRSFRKKEFSNAVVILERACEAGHEEPYILFLLALSLLYENNFSKAESILSHLDRLNSDYIPYLHLRSFMGLKSASNQQDAVRIYVSSLEKHADDKILNKILRKIISTGDFASFQKNARIEDCVKIDKPTLALRRSIGKGSRRALDIIDFYNGSSSFKKIIFFIALALIIGAGFFTLINYQEYALNLFKQDNFKSDDKIEMVTIGGAGYGLLNRVNKEKTPEFYTSSEILLGDFNKAKKLIKSGDYNSALIILNKIDSSNSSYIVKEKIKFLIRFIFDSNERKYEKCNIKTIMSKPYLYRGYSLQVAGRVANVKPSGKGMSFSLMIDYDGKNFTAVSEVFSQDKVPLSNGDMVDVQGLYIADIGKENMAFISARNITVTARLN